MPTADPIPDQLHAELTDRLTRLGRLLDQLATTAIVSPATPARRVELTLAAVVDIATTIEDELDQLARTLNATGVLDDGGTINMEET